MGVVRGALEGRNGRLFLADQDGFALEWFLGAPPFTRSLMEVWKRTLRRRAREFKRRGIPYVFYLAPDAHHMYPEDLPEGMMVPGAVPPGEYFLSEMGGVRDVTFVNPRADLRTAHGALEIYRKTDTHWSQYGSYVGYRTLCRALRGIVAVSEIPARDIDFEYRRLFGDLGVLVEPERSEETIRVRIAGHEYRRLSEYVGFDRTGYVESVAPGAAPVRALFMRDSFMTDQYEYVARSFGNVLCAGTTTSMFLDEVDAWKPDVVITHIGERRLYAYEVDHRPESFDDLFRSDFLSERGKDARRAKLLLAARKPQEALAQIEPFETAADLRPDHSFVAAQVLHACGHNERAGTALRAALEADPERFSYLLLAAQILFALDRRPEAIATAERAVASAPYNGFCHQIYATLLLQDANPAAARTHLAAILPEIDDYCTLWYLLSLACEALGERYAATEAIVEALLLDSSSPVFRDKAVQLWTS